MDLGKFVSMVVESEDSCFWNSFFVFFVLWIIVLFVEIEEKVVGGGWRRIESVWNICFGEGEFESIRDRIVWGRVKVIDDELMVVLYFCEFF